MTPASQAAIVAAAGFFLTGLVLGLVKYVFIASSSAAQAPRYIDIGHRAALMYAFACLLIERLVILSTLPDRIEWWAVLVQIVFFALATLSYIVHGVLRDTDNQLQRPHRLGKRTLSPVSVVGFMMMLTIAEIGGFVVLVWGVL